MRRAARDDKREKMDAQRAFRAQSARQRAIEVASNEDTIQGVLAKKLPLLAFPEDPFLYPIEKKAPKLLEHPTYRRIIERMGATGGHLRPINDWTPRGKGCETLYRSLCEHIWAKYPMPAFIWSAFFDKLEWLDPLVKDIARGSSLFTLSKEGKFPLPMTRAMVHELMTSTPGDIPFTKAVRRVQVKTAGGTPRFFQVWAGTRPGQALGTKAEETFWASVVEWFSKQPMLDPTQVAPLVDFIGYRRNHERDFSMKGRSPMALIRGMQEWHGDLAKVKATNGAAYERSGFRGLEMECSGEGNTKDIWRIQEILSAKELIAEGRDLHHCVASYSWRVEAKQVSIWSMTCKPTWESEKKMVTIEVTNGPRAIIQARGRFNRAIEAGVEFKVMQRWAQDNGLSISIGRW